MRIYCICIGLYILCACKYSIEKMKFQLALHFTKNKRNAPSIRTISSAMITLTTASTYTYTQRSCDCTGYSKTLTNRTSNTVLVVDDRTTEQTSIGNVIIAEMKKYYHTLVSVLSSINRILYFSILYTPVICTSLILLLSDGNSSDSSSVSSVSGSGSVSTTSILKQQWWKYFMYCLSVSGPCVLKLSQWASTRPDLLPVALCKHLTELQANARTPSHTHAYDSLRKAFGTNWSSWLILDRPDSSSKSSSPLVVLGTGTRQSYHYLASIRYTDMHAYTNIHTYNHACTHTHSF